MNIRKCAQGHTYDSDVYMECPYCSNPNYINYSEMTPSNAGDTELLRGSGAPQSALLPAVPVRRPKPVANPPEVIYQGAGYYGGGSGGKEGTEASNGTLIKKEPQTLRLRPFIRLPEQT